MESVINETNPDGSVTQKKVTVTAGKKVLIRGTLEDAEYVGEAQDVVYDYDNPVLNFIGYIDNELEPTVIEKLKSTEPSSGTSQAESSSQDSGSSSTGTQTGGQTGTTTGGTTSQPDSYTVTFTYGGATFATQTVTENGTAQEPELCPAASGRWNFDFTSPITQNTTLEWN